MDRCVPVVGILVIPRHLVRYNPRCARASRMDKRTNSITARTTDLDTSTAKRKEEKQRAWTPGETRKRRVESSCTIKGEELLTASDGLPEDTSNKRGCKSAAQVWMSLLSLCDRMCGSAAWLVLFTCLHGVRFPARVIWFE